MPKGIDMELMASRKEKKVKAASSPKKASKKRKDPNAAPERALSAFGFFVKPESKMRKKLSKEGMDDIREVRIACEAAWRELDDEGKSKFKAMAAEDKIRAANEMEAYQQLQVNPFI